MTALKNATHVEVTKFTPEKERTYYIWVTKDQGGYEVVGVSRDSAASHVKFKEKHALPFPLIADVDKTLLQAMGAWGEKVMYGKKTEGTIRTTFIINEEGIIEQIFAGKQVKTKEHAEQILQKKSLSDI